MKKLKIGMLLFPGMTLQDFAGPYDVFRMAPCFEVYLIAKHTAFIRCEGGLKLNAELSFKDCPAMDILFVPGGRGINNLLMDEECIDFLKKQGEEAQYVTSVCTGALLLAAAGLLKGHKATTHWRSLALLQMLGIEAVEERVVIDGNCITGGGITAGIDFGLMVTALIGGEEMAKLIQLQLEYDPMPPFEAGSPKKVDRAILQKSKAATQPIFEERVKLIKVIMAEKTL